MKIQISKERKITSLIIAIVSFIIFIVVDTLVLRYIDSSLAGSSIVALKYTIQTLIAIIVPFTLYFVHYNILLKRGFAIKDMAAACVLEAVLYEGASFIIKLIAYKVLSNAQVNMAIIYLFISVPIYIFCMYQAGISITRTPEEAEAIKQQVEAMKNKQSNKQDN